MFYNDEQRIAWFLLAVFLLLALLTGCSSISRNPVEINCTGKGQITGTGYAGATVAVGGHEANTFTLSADCGDGFSYRAGPPAQSGAAK